MQRIIIGSIAIIVIMFIVIMQSITIANYQKTLENYKTAYAKMEFAKDTWKESYHIAMRMFYECEGMEVDDTNTQ